MVEILALALFLQTGASTLPVTSTQPEPPPYQDQWTVEVIDNIKVLPESNVTLRIDGQTVTGRAPCNTYRGSFTVSGTTVEVGELLRTMMACDAARLSEENDFLTLLREVVRYEMKSRDVLELKTSDGKTIVAKRQR